MESIVRFGLIASLALVGVLAIGLPIARAYAITGRSGLVVQDRARPVQRVVGSAMAFLVLSTVVWGMLVAIFGPGRLGVLGVPLWVSVSGLGLIVLSTLWIAIAQWWMGTSWRIGIDREPGALVTSGPFALVRNPIFSGMLAALLGVVLATPSPWTLSILVQSAIVIAIQTRLEEAHLARLGEPYRAYAARVGRFVPWIGRTLLVNVGPCPHSAA